MPRHHERQHGYGHKLGEVVKGGAASALVLYPATKLVWGLDSAAKNYLPVGMPSYARTPVVTLALGAVAAALPGGYWTEKIGEMVLAAGLMQTVQQYGQTVPGQPGTIDAAVNKVFIPISELGMKGYTERLRGYVQQRRMAGYVEMGAPVLPGAGTRVFNVQPTHPNDMGRSGRSDGLRGFQAEHVGQ